MRLPALSASVPKAGGFFFWYHAGMPLHLRRSTESFLQYTVRNDAGYKVGIIRDASHHVTGPNVWEWYINGEAGVGQLVSANGSAPSLDQAKADFAKNWRRWL